MGLLRLPVFVELKAKRGMSVLNASKPITKDRRRLVMASGLNLSKLKLRLATRVADRHRREPRVVWSREEVARLVIEELADSHFDFDSADRLPDVKAVLLEAYRVIRVGGRTWRIDP